MPADLQQPVTTLLDRCDHLARFTQDPPPRLTRTFLSGPMRDVHRSVTEWMTAAGLSVRIDGIGNIVGRRDGATPDAPALLIGSHLDTVPDAGKYDGVLGVLLGVAAAGALKGRPLPFAIEVVGFSEEEGCRFPTAYLGSPAFVGQLTPQTLALRDQTGISVAEAIAAYGLDPRTLSFDASQYLGYLEPHIEQGPVLESLGAPLGVVTSVVGQSRRRVRFVGRSGHAGTTPMHLRRDALAAAAAWVNFAERVGHEFGGVVTVGQIAAAPGASNVIAGNVTASLDVRHADDAARAAAVARIFEAGRIIAERRGVTFEVDDAASCDLPTVAMDPRLTALLRAAAGGEGAPLLPSGAGHDAAVLARVMPACMLFVRSPGGVSHHPDERVYAADVERALATTIRFIEALAHAHAGFGASSDDPDHGATISETS